MLTLNVAGADLFGEDGAAFRSLIALRKALEAGDGDKIRAMAVPMESALDRVAKARSIQGAFAGRVEALPGRSGRGRTSYEDGRSPAEDLDVTRAVVDLQQEQMALQAALKSRAQILNLSLLDFT